MTNLITNLDAIDSLFAPIWRKPYRENPVTSVRPRIDIRENEQEFIIFADLPGVQKDDLSVDIEKDTLTIKAQRNEKEEEGAETLHIERFSLRSYERSFTLGKDVDPDGIKGRLNDGVLTLTVPKKEKVLPRRISVD